MNKLIMDKNSLYQNHALTQNLQDKTESMIYTDTPQNKKLIGARHEKTCLLRVANNKGADQPAHMRSLIRALANCLSIL